MAMLVAIALRGLNVARPRPLDKIAVIGLGPIGLLSARLFQGQGCTVLGMDREPARVRLAADGGLDACLVGKSIADTVRSRFGSGADIVVDATGSGPVLRGSMEAAKDLAWGDSDALGSKLVIQGSYSGDFNLPYHKAFRKELNIFIPRDVTPREISAAIGIIAENKCLVDDLITCCDDPKHSPRAYSLLQSDRSQMTAAFDWTSYGI
jgi:L-iditol 2-dehydrogenase